MSTLLRVETVEVGYGDLTAVSEVSLEVREGEAVALIGANGAGKTTTLRAVSGLLPLRGRSSPETVRRVVVLPAPLAPSSVTISPGKTWTSTFRRTLLEP